MATDPVTAALQGAKKTLARANRFTQSVEGNPTSAFAPKPPKKIEGIKAASPPHEHSDAPYALAHDLRSKQENVDQYKKAVDANQ